MTTKTTPQEAAKLAAKHGAAGMISDVVITTDQLAALIDDVRNAPLSDDDKRDLNIGKAINRAAMELPESCSISIELSLGSGSVVWFDEDDHGECAESGEPFSAQIHAAIDAAIASVSPK